MFTCCPHCKTCFRITKPQLDIAQGKVRCGKCKQVFNGKLYLSDDIPKPKPKTRVKKPATAAPPGDEAATTADKTPPPESPRPKPVPAPEPPPEPVDAEPAAVNRAKGGTPSDTARNLDLDLFANHDFSGTIEAEDEDDSWLEHLDEDEHEDYDDYDDDMEDETEVIDMDDAHEDIFASLENIIPAEALEDDENAVDEATQSEILQSELDEALEAMQKYEAEARASDSVFDYLPEEDDEEEEEEVFTGIRQPEQLAEPETSPPPEPEPAAESPREQDDDRPAAEADTHDSAYEYVDPASLLNEEKGIEDILKDMDAQLQQTLPTEDELPMPIEGDDEPGKEEESDDPSIFFKPDQWVLTMDDEPDARLAQPMASKEDKADKDPFESEFLASLDSTLAEAADEAAAPPKPGDRQREKKKISYEDEEPFLGLDGGTAPAVPGPMDDLPGGPDDEEELPYRLRDDFVAQEKSHGLLYYLGGGLLILILTATLLLQIAVFRVNDVVEYDPELEPVMTRLCQALPCHFNHRTAVERIKLLSRDIRKHPREPNALLITATMVNRAGFPQPYPDIQISLSDLGGDVVARRRFSPREYLGREPSPFLRMPVGKPVKIALEVIDPGQDAVNFQFAFREPASR